MVVEFNELNIKTMTKLSCFLFSRKSKAENSYESYVDELDPSLLDLSIIIAANDYLCV